MGCLFKKPPAVEATPPKGIFTYSFSIARSHLFTALSLAGWYHFLPLTVLTSRELVLVPDPAPQECTVPDTVSWEYGTLHSHQRVQDLTQSTGEQYIIQSNGITVSHTAAPPPQK